MSPLRLTGSTSGYSQLDAPAVAGDQTFTLPGTGGTLDRLNRAGNILQVVSDTGTDSTLNNNNTYTGTGLSATITPSATNNKILVLVTLSSASQGDSLYFTYQPNFRILRNSVEQKVYSIGLGAGDSSSGYTFLSSQSGVSYLDSPSSTSALTYSVEYKGAYTSVGVVDYIYGSTSSITLMEVAA